MQRSQQRLVDKIAEVLFTMFTDFSPYAKSEGQLIDFAGFAMSDLPVTNPIPPTAPRCSEAASCISLKIQEVPNS